MAQWLMIGAHDLTLPETPSLLRYGRGFVLDVFFFEEVGLSTRTGTSTRPTATTRTRHRSRPTSTTSRRRW